MGLDIYAGTLTRYYTRNWKNRSQQYAEEIGVKCRMTDEHGNEIKPVEDKAEIEKIRDAVCQWADFLTTNIDPDLPSPAWDEKSEHDYFTEKPGSMAYDSLMMLMAYRILDRRLPKYVGKVWDPSDDPVVEEARSQKLPGSLLPGATLWLPIAPKVIFVSDAPLGGEILVSTISVLKEELEEINREMWNADETTILSWKSDKYYVPVRRMSARRFLLSLRYGRDMGIEIKRENFLTEDLAKCAYSILYDAVRFATEKQVPVILDY